MTQKGHLGPGPPNEKGWLWIGGPKTKIEAWGLGIWKLAREANDGRIWPEAIEHQRGPIVHKRYGVSDWPQLGSKLDCRNTHGGGSLLVVVTVPPYLEWRASEHQDKVRDC
ncbi:hypothetical protein O181_025826 [Austropuccinia psidii MF-1]|uniref:Uncharacterized protein n=1 Tax=Austropuccinia psidii MF-1 TaxID=1389203 RepID=A0A9Q3CP87_9BASI|nr:hypothetical protein [Austropuccinia psidii MF-1]